MRRLVDTPCGCLEVHDVGRSEAPLILLLPIVPFSSWIWRTAQTVFAARGWRTIAVDPMGYGRSDKRRGVWTVGDFAQNLDDLLAAVEAPRAFVVAGHFAALPAIELAVAHPDRVAALWLDGPPVWSAQMRATVAASRASSEPETWSIQDDMGALVWQRLTSMLKKLAPDGFAPGPALNDALRRALIDFTEASFEPTTVAAILSYDTEARAALVACPTMVVAGEYDEQKRNLPLITAVIPGAQTQMIGGLHPIHDLAHPDRAAEYVDQVLTFFEANTPTWN